MENSLENKTIKFYYDGLLMRKNFYLNQNHCLESFWGGAFLKNREEEKENFFATIIRAAIPSVREEQLKGKFWQTLKEIVKKDWEEVFFLHVKTENLSNLEYEEKIKLTFQKLKDFLKKYSLDEK